MIVVVLKDSSIILFSLVDSSCIGEYDVLSEVEDNGHQVVYTVTIPLTVVVTIEGCKLD